MKPKAKLEEKRELNYPIKSGENLEGLLSGEGAKEYENKCRGHLNKIVDKLSSFAYDLYNIKVPLGAAALATGLDRYLTYVGLKTMPFAQESNPMVAAYFGNFGLMPGLILSGIIELVGYAGAGKVFETTLADGKLPRNSLVKAGLYGVTISEALAALNNYEGISGKAVPIIQQLEQNYGVGPTMGIVYALSFLPMIGTAAYYSIKSALRARKERRAEVAKCAEVNLNGTKD